MIPIIIENRIFWTKYGYAHIAIPESKKINRVVFLPYMKYPKPMVPIRKDHNRLVVFIKSSF